MEIIVLKKKKRYEKHAVSDPLKHYQTQYRTSRISYAQGHPRANASFPERNGVHVRREFFPTIYYVVLKLAIVTAH